MGPIPDHIAFIMDGNRRYFKNYKFDDGAGHKLGASALISMLEHCYELGVKYVTVHPFSIDNKKQPEEVNFLTELLKEIIEGLLNKESIINQYEVRLHFAGDLKLLDDPVRLSAEKAMASTAGNSKEVLTVCLSYTYTNEIINVVEESCIERRAELRILDSCGSTYGLTDYTSNGDTGERKFISLTDTENHIYMKVALNAEIMIRTSGENRLSNFLLW